MAKMIFVNLPVTDLAKSVAFYEAVGATRNPQFSDNTGACMVFSDSIYVMLSTHDKYRQFSPKPIADTKATSAVILNLSQDSRAEVDAVVEKARAAGGKPDPSPPDDYGFMYGRGFEDHDGHLWGIMWMDPAAVANGPPEIAKS
jgi:hypothetical protein